MATMSNATSPARPEQYDSIVLFGDSLVERSFSAPGGLGLELGKLYARKMDVVNRGFSGYNTSWAIEVAKRIFPPAVEPIIGSKTALVMIWFGANDSTLPHSPQAVPLPLFKENLHSLIKILTLHAPSTKFLLLTPPPVDLAKWGVVLEAKDPGGRMDREVSRTRTFVDAVIEVAAEAGVPAVDLHEAVTKEAERRQVGVGEFLVDGLHLTDGGYEVVLAAVRAKLKTALPALDADVMPSVFPGWFGIINDGFFGDKYLAAPKD